MAKANKVVKKQKTKNAPSPAKAVNTNQTASPKNANGVKKNNSRAQQRKNKKDHKKNAKVEEKAPKAVAEVEMKEEEEDEQPKVNKGMKMFKGVPKKEVVPKMEEDSDDDSEAELNSSEFSLGNGDSTIDDEDVSDEESDDDESSDKNKSMNIEELLGESLADDDDDDDDATFEAEGEDDEDESMSEDDEEEEEKITPKKESKKSPVGTDVYEKFSPEVEARTIFVGNVSIDTNKNELEKAFKKYGAIESSRFRGAIPSDPKMSKKVAAMTKKTHPKVKTQIAYITFEKEQSAQKALAMNGQKLNDNTLRVTKAKKDDQSYNQKKSIFLGNLAFGMIFFKYT